MEKNFITEAGKPSKLLGANFQRILVEETKVIMPEPDPATATELRDDLEANTLPSIEEQLQDLKRTINILIDYINKFVKAS